MFSCATVKEEFLTSWFFLSKLYCKKKILMIQIQGKSKLSSYEIEWNSDKWKEKVEPQWIMEPNQKRCSKGNNKILWMLIFKC